ncbi:xanthine dehydrogenase molybdenum-binding subunit XdhA [Desulfosarcina ovata subsp. sediminis]|uniref:Xanthine dehydrogenase molybdenum-binding subunit XdhA n=1 Tax=Desulfosarcina ovata subsp. sediminis TaxID=885957 RepID=A0A5K7ZIL5_9BACT|nr:xanthine dehydrogenase family protein molybdopterin-binding subunit [Desulfosarcina ovata]BBO82068.1 xanthine dehydrogenase molybdenum-binding subunit XdhA [Desulfosarcina ovata subsp. sediminis]
MARRYRHIGKGTKRLDAEDIVTGKAQYVDDLKIPDMLYGRVLRSPYPHANIKRIDTSRAEKLPGVAAVLTHENGPDWRMGSPKHGRILDSRVRFAGDAVALIAAKTIEIAEEAMDLIDVEYEQLPAVYDVEEALKPDAPQLYDDFPGNFTPRDKFLFFGPDSLQEIVMGDTEKGFKEADVVAEGTCSFENFPNALPPEPPSVIIKWEDPDQVTVWSAEQGAYMPKTLLTATMGFPDVRAINPQVGGSYGTKYSIIPQVYAAALAKAVGHGTPVKIVLTKEEHLMAYQVRIGSRMHAKVGIKKDGTVTALDCKWLVDSGYYSFVGPAQVAVGLGEAMVTLRCANWNMQPYVVYTNRNASGSARGFGGQELKSALLPIVTLAMEKADLDPVDFYKKNFAKPGDGYYWRDGKWWVCRGNDYSKAMEKGAEAFGWKDKWKGWGKPTAVNGMKRIGVGCGVHGNADVGEDRSEAYIRIHPHGTAVVHVCVAEIGGGQRSSLRKMAAEILNLPLDNVYMTPCDSLVNPFDFGLAGSRGTYTLGNAVTKAAEDAKQQLFRMAAPVLDAEPEDLDTEDGKIYSKKKPEKKIWWSTVMGRDSTITGMGAHEPDFSIPNFFMTFVEVQVDVETGSAELLRVVGATDVGQIIDPLALAGQLYGALGSAGMDTALFEETIVDKTTGRILNGNMIDYKWRTSLELPEFQQVILETPLPTHTFKAIGVGEITPSPGAAAILMAIYNAIGKRITEYPATPDKILKALGKIRGGEAK